MSERGGLLRDAVPFPISRSLVQTCLLDTDADRLFESAWRTSLNTIDRSQRGGRLAHVTGHMAESVGELLWVDLGYQVVWHLTGPGTHGVDLVILCPSGERILVVEVKGTLRGDRWPGLSRRTLRQMSDEWLNKADNPGMTEWTLRSEDVFGGVMLVNFAEMAFKVGLTNDFTRWVPVMALDQLVELAWLDPVRE